MSYKAVEALRWGALPVVERDTTDDVRVQSETDELLANAALMFRDHPTKGPT